MVNTIDICRLNLDELSGVVSLYPWFASARAELCIRFGEAGACSDALLSASALYVPSRRRLYARVRGNKGTDCSDSEAQHLLDACISPKKEEAAAGPRIILAGADFFSTEDYRSVASPQTDVHFRPVTETKDSASGAESDSTSDIYTETLAEIYLEQGYVEEAREIYSKLILRYPEKSVYFATLLEKIKSI